MTHNHNNNNTLPAPNVGLVLHCKETNDFIPHPEGIHPAVCLDVIDMGLVELEFQQKKELKQKIKVIFESDQRMDDGTPFTVSKNFTASLHPKAKLTEFLGKWRGRPVLPGESIDLSRLIGACCTLVISHQQNALGRTYAAIDAISKPTRKVTPSGHYNPIDFREKIAAWKAKQSPTGPVAPPSQQPTTKNQELRTKNHEPQTPNQEPRTPNHEHPSTINHQQSTNAYAPDVGF